jgi:hypothetical protein
MPVVLIMMLFITLLFMLFNITSMLGQLMPISEIIMIYVLTLMWKLPNYSAHHPTANNLSKQARARHISTLFSPLLHSAELFT